jgi:hypothetical protein
MITSTEDLAAIPTPATPVTGVPRWADDVPTNTELAATIQALPALVAAVTAAHQAYVAAEHAAAHVTLPDFDHAPTDPLDLLAATRLWDTTCDLAHRAARNSAAAARAHRDELRSMLSLVLGHEVIDGIAVKVEHHTSGDRETLSVSSAAREFTRYAEAVTRGGTWSVELGQFEDLRTGTHPAVHNPRTAQEARALAIAHVTGQPLPTA